MEGVLISAGAACLIAATVGGGLKAFQIEIPLLASPKRQILLALLGAAFLAIGLLDFGQVGSIADSGEAKRTDHSANESSQAGKEADEFIDRKLQLTSYMDRLLRRDADPFDNTGSSSKLVSAMWAMEIEPNGSNHDLRVAVFDRLESIRTRQEVDALIQKVEQSTGDKI